MIAINYTFDQLSYNFIEEFWEKFQSYLHLSSSEINELYLCAKKYFDPDINENFMNILEMENKCYDIAYSYYLNREQTAKITDRHYHCYNSVQIYIYQISDIDENGAIDVYSVLKGIYIQ